MNGKNPEGRCQRCGAPVRYLDQFCPECGAKNNSWTVPDKKFCGNCHTRLEKGDRYCRVCGTRAGEGAFEPYQQVMQCIYGPRPVERRHVCGACGHEWTNFVMVDRDRFCPECGAEILPPEKTDDR